MNTHKYLGNYEIDIALGANAFFECFRAVDAVRKRTVIIKVLKPDVLGDRQLAQRFLYQAQLANELVHPHLAWVWDAGEVNGQHYIVERYVDGKSLLQILGDQKKVPAEQAREIINQISRGLDFAHARGFAHGNIRPGNIVVNPELGAILTDIGPSIALQALTPRWAAGIDLEMAPYIAPEIWQGKSPSAKSDQYSLACVLAEMLSGEKPFGAISINAMKEKHLSTFQTPLSWAVSIPWPTTKAILRALEQEPSKRFNDLESFSQAPQDIKEEIRTNPKLKAEAEDQAQAWQAAQQKVRQDAEEAARLAALEKAKREIEEELNRQGSIPNSEPPSVSEFPSEEQAQTARTTVEKSRSGRSPKVRRGQFGIVLFIILIALAGIWLVSSFSDNNNLPTNTPTPTAIVPSRTATIAASHTPQNTITPTSTPTRTATATKTSTLSKTPTITDTSTMTPTTTLTYTPTRTPKDDDTSISGGT